MQDNACEIQTTAVLSDLPLNRLTRVPSQSFAWLVLMLSYLAGIIIAGSANFRG